MVEVQSCCGAVVLVLDSECIKGMIKRENYPGEMFPSVRTTTQISHSVAQKNSSTGKDGPIMNPNLDTTETETSR